MTNATDDVARQLRTGQLLEANVTETSLKKAICDRMEIMVAKGCPDLLVDLQRIRDFCGLAAAVTVKHQVTGDEGRSTRPASMSEPGGPLTKNMLRVFYTWPVMTDFMAQGDVEPQGQQDAAFRHHHLAERTVRRLTRATRKLGNRERRDNVSTCGGAWQAGGVSGVDCPRRKRPARGCSSRIRTRGAAAAVHVFRDDGGLAGDRDQQEGKPRRQHGRRPGDPAADDVDGRLNAIMEIGQSLLHAILSVQARDHHHGNRDHRRTTAEGQGVLVAQAVDRTTSMQRPRRRDDHRRFRRH